MRITLAEYNTIITFLGMLCATVQASTGYYAAFIMRRPALLRTNGTLNRAHRSFGGFATTLYFLGLFNGLNSLTGAFINNDPPLELASWSFNIHTWGSFPAMAIIIYKTWTSYFDSGAMFGKRKWLGPAAFFAWTFTWVTAAVSYYLRTLPDSLQHPEPSFLLPYNLVGLQIVLPFIIGGLVGRFIVRRADRQEKKKLHLRREKEVLG
jgi:hypothetical protein